MTPHRPERPEDAIINPGNPDHFMSVRPVTQVVTATYRHRTLAQSAKAVQVCEVGMKVYAPVLYVPRDALWATLVPSKAAPTHCPLKGDARYFDLADEGGARIATKIAWSYEYTFGFARQLEDLIAFFPETVTLTTTSQEADHAQNT